MTDRDDATIYRSVFKSTAMLTVADLATRLTTLIVTLVISRALGTASLGVYATATATYGLIAVAGGLGATNYMVREIAKRPEDTSRFFGHVAILAVALGGLLTGGFLMVLPYLGYSRQLQAGMAVVIVALIPGVMATLMRAVFVAHQRVVGFTYTVAIAAFVSVGVSWWLLSTGGSITVVLVAFVTERVVVTIVGLVMIHRNIAPLSLRFDWGYARTILSDVRTFAALSLLAAAFSQPELLIMASLIGDEATGVFNAGFRIVSFWMIMPTVLMTNVFPLMARTAGTSAQERKLQHTAVRYLSIVTFPVVAGMMAAAGPIIRLFYGPGFEEAVLPFIILSPLLLFYSLDQVYWRVLAARNEQGKDLRVRIVTVVLRIGLGFALISTFGLNGGAITATLAVALAAVMLAYYVRRGGTPLAWLQLMAPSMISAGVMAAAVWWLADRLPLVAVIGLAVVVYAGMGAVTGMLSADDRRLLASAVRRSRSDASDSRPEDSPR